MLKINLKIIIVLAAQIKNEIEVRKTDSSILMKSLNYDPVFIDAIRKIPGSKFDFVSKFWIIDIKNIDHVNDLFADPLFEYPKIQK